MKILALGAHPDDIELFMYGTLDACKKRGDKIFLAIATDGAAGKVKIKNDLKKIRVSESLLGLELLGKPMFLNFSDGNLSSEPLVAEVIKDIINDLKPDLIITHAPEDYHPDHRALSNYATQAAGFVCPVIFCETLMGLNFTPDIYVDVTNSFLKKTNAILAHKSQSPEKFLKAIKLMNRYRSAQCNNADDHYAEVFRFDKKFPFGDLRSFLPNPPAINLYYENDIRSFI